MGALEKAFQRLGRDKFSTEHKAAAALKLIDGWARDPATLTEATRTQAQAVFAAVNARFEPQGNTTA